MKLIVGLGNHGQQYEMTRHNMGYLAADFIASTYHFEPWCTKHKGFLSKGIIKSQKTLLLKPETYMNLSGDAVISTAQYYKIKPEDIIILSDDLDMVFGKVRYRAEGRDGGQKGLRDIFKKLKTEKIDRIKFGISNDYRDKVQTADFVLSKLSKTEQSQLPEILKEGAIKLLENCF